MSIWINSESSLKIDIEKVIPFVEIILKTLNIENGEVSILFVDNEDIKSLNKTYRGIDKPTDVLSFPQNEGTFKNLNNYLLGDIVISLERAKEQAPESDNSFFEEVIFLIIHSILHLIGYTHDEIEDREEMQNREVELFKICFPNIQF